MNAKLRAWSKSDATALHHAISITDDLATQFGDAELATADLCRNFISEHLAGSNTSTRNFAISVDRTAVGNVGVSNMEDRNNTGWVYYWLSADARGQGLTTRALASVAEWAFSVHGLHRLELGHRVNNPASCQVAHNAGFPAEGIERQKLSYGDRRYDVETHARLATDPVPGIDLLRIH